MPGLGVLQSEISSTDGRITSVLCKEGQAIRVGTPVLRVSGPHCPGAACVIQATHDGVINEILKKQGNELHAGEAFMSLLNPSGLTVRLDIPTKYIGFISSGQKIRVWFSQMPEKAHELQVSEILPAVGLGETTRGVRLESLPPPPGTGLDSLVNAEIPIPLGGSGIRVPATAVGFHRGSHFIVKKEGTELQAVPVHILSEFRNDLWIRPEAGGLLKSGDSILSTQVIFFLEPLLESEKEQR
jgi:hypothetical protein